ncbi:alpha-amylase family protein [Paenibacillaceae bacterium WGS1546]|uniref:alpha-amylase family protein n=1 Tax=Cohnella sp. WGS1546 TaxID=3366810 RepID=UPI00372D0982
METNELRFRQIHLDFHNSELIPGIGERFDPDAFADRLTQARVNSINLFARCHHGMMYYDSEQYPERIHPGMNRNDLLERQAAACHAKDIHVNLYTTVRWDVYTVREHPEWIAITADGAYSDYEGKTYFEAGFYTNLCVNTPYRQFLKNHLAEALERIPVEGVWFDASFIVECCCRNCLEGMRERGLDPKNPRHRTEFSEDVYQDFVRDMSAFVRSLNPSYTIFYNKGHVGSVDKPVLDGYSYAAFESLPGGPWGYMDFPVSVRYVRTLKTELIGMTGRFHTAWGDFHSFRNRAALEYEVYSMLAQGAKCSIGDQLEPSGMLSAPMYELIGSVYSEVEKKEPWCQGAVPVTEIGVFTPEEFYGAGTGNLPAASEGICRMLQEGGYQFDFIDSEADFCAYKLLILPDVIPVSRRLSERLEQFVGNGGALIASHESGLDAEKTDFNLELLGVRYKGAAPFSPDYIVPRGEIGAGLHETEYVMYKQGSLVEAKDEESVLAWTHEPFFNRAYEHFTSHAHTPSSGKRGYPAIVQRGRAIYFMHPVFTQYHENAPRWCKQLILNALEMLLPEPLLRHDGPSTLAASMTRQSEERRSIVHLLHYIPERRSATMDIIEDVIPLHDVRLSLNLGRKVKAVELVPVGEALSFAENDGRIEFTVPRIDGHLMVAVHWAE